ncbi:GGDEF domain-containing protein [Kineococcus rhizosphaerae]|uniref:GGDEF domain-containing protein n=1 Tax=Kineococcus rhizosphaerae TaxID=559628 RepID=UPI000D061E28|nr:GGDEF domain-containing protein [Kineococcus rhizosphaerae]
MPSPGTGVLVRAHLTVGVALSVLCVCLPAGPVHDALYSVISCGCVALMVVGVRRHRPRAVAGWWLTTCGVAAWAAADLLWAVYTWVLHVSPFPSPADALYLTSYALIACGFWRFVRARRGQGDPEGFVDSLIFTVGFVLLSWVLLMRPGLESAGESSVARVLAAAYPLGDVLLLAFLVRLLTTSGARTASFRWLVAGNTLLLVADCAYQYVEMTTGYSGGLITLPWLLGYVCFATAALHPSMRALTDGDGRQAGTRFTRRRLAALTLASLVAPGTLLVELALGLRLEGWAVGVSSVVLFALVVQRMSGLLRRLDQQAAKLSELARTDALTGLPNRRTGDAELARMQVRALEEGLPLCVAVLDLDRFKAFNDTYGHQAGDQLLVQASAAWRERLVVDRVGAGAGRSAMLGRWGGEEFLLLVLGRDLASAVAVVDSLRAVTPAGQTFSAGVAQWDGTSSAAELFAAADTALYAAKCGGRDAVVAAPAPVQVQLQAPTR